MTLAGAARMIAQPPPDSARQTTCDEAAVHACSRGPLPHQVIDLAAAGLCRLAVVNGCRRPKCEQETQGSRQGKARWSHL